MAPIPNPRKDESDKEFISRCMSDLSQEYPDNKQRAAICYNSLRESKKSKGESEDMQEVVDELLKKKESK